MKILFFAPHSAIWAHAFPEALVAEALQQHGDEIIYVGCGGVLKNHCVSMSAFGVSTAANTSEKERICAICKKDLNILRSRFDFAGGNLTDLVIPADVFCADEIMMSVTPANCLGLNIDGVEIGKIALYEILLKAKKNSLNFSAEEWGNYKIALKNVILTLRGAQRLLDGHLPDRVVLYNALYSVNRVVCRLAELRGIPQYFLHAGANLSKRIQTLWLGRGDAFSFYAHMLSKWNDLKDTPRPSNELSTVTDHFLEVVQGRSAWAYSVAPKGSDQELKDFFGINPDQKVICATMSSYDERFAAEIVGAISPNIPALFSTQVEWINALIEYVGARPDQFLIIRVHPREFPNKRDGSLSEHAKLLKNVLTALPNNVRVNWPVDNISLYSIANITNVFANSWSSVGKEMGLLGLPVVLYSHCLTDYPADLNYVGITHDAYFHQLEQALIDGWSAERIRKTYRWCAIEYHRIAFDISDSFSRNEHAVITLPMRIKNKLLRTVAPYHQQYFDCSHRASRLSASEVVTTVIQNQLDSILDLQEIDLTVTLQDETKSLKREVSRMVSGLYGPNICFPENSLVKKLQDFAMA